jgi:hypothetical protein
LFTGAKIRKKFELTLQGYDNDMATDVNSVRLLLRNKSAFKNLARLKRSIGLAQTIDRGDSCDFPGKFAAQHSIALIHQISACVLNPLGTV